MRRIPLIQDPGQEFSVTVDGNRWLLRIKIAVRSMIADIYLNDEALLYGAKIAVGTPLIPYEHMAQQGNFILVVDDEELPDWQQFGGRQQLYYVYPGELEYGDDEYEFPTVKPYGPEPLMAPYNLRVLNI